MANVIQIDLNKILAGTPYEKERVVGVALSGGRDSIALCHALKEAGENIIAINVDHGIRGEASERDSAFVQKFCEKEGIPLYFEKVDALGFAKECGYTVEQAARILRYAVFDRAVSDGRCDIVALAHHADDQAETILMHVLRGTGIKGLVGMQKYSQRLVRPFLDYTREDIDAYVKEHGLEYVEDETNEDETYTRNFLRAELKRLKERYPDLDNSFARLSRIALETEEFIESILPKIEVKDDEVFVKAENSENPFILKRLVLKAAGALCVSQDIEEKHLSAVVELAKNENGKSVDLTHGLVAVKEADGIVIAKRKESKKSDVATLFGIGDFKDFGIVIEEAGKIPSADELKRREALYCDWDKIPQAALIRRRRDGDFIEKFGGGTKSLGDFLTDKKVPARKRDELIVVALGSEVLIVFGVEISAKVKIDETTKNVLKLTVKPEK